MPRSKDEIRGICEERGIGWVESNFSKDPVTFLQGAELGYAKEWLQEQRTKTVQEQRAEYALEIARDANKIAKFAAIAALASAVASILAVILGA